MILKTTEDGKDESDPCMTNCSPTFTILDPLGSANDLVRKDERKNPSIACTTTIRHSFGFKYYFCDAVKTLFYSAGSQKVIFFFQLLVVTLYMKKIALLEQKKFRRKDKNLFFSMGKHSCFTSKKKKEKIS